MASTGDYLENSYSASTKAKIFQAVLKNPGLTVTEIAQRLRLKENRVNSFLLDEGCDRYGLVFHKEKWYSPSTTSMRVGLPKIKASSNGVRKKQGLKQILSWPIATSRPEPKIPRKTFLKAEDDSQKWSESFAISFDRRSFCSRLEDMGTYSAESMLRVMSLKEIERAFLEDDFVMLPDQFKALLGTRYEYLMTQLDKRLSDNGHSLFGLEKYGEYMLWSVLAFALITQMWPLIIFTGLLIWRLND